MFKPKKQRFFIRFAGGYVRWQDNDYCLVPERARGDLFLEDEMRTVAKQVRPEKRPRFELAAFEDFRRWAASLGGRTRSPARALASRLNARKPRPNARKHTC